MEKFDFPEFHVLNFDVFDFPGQNFDLFKKIQFIEFDFVDFFVFDFAYPFQTSQ